MKKLNFNFMKKVFMVLFISVASMALGKMIVYACTATGGGASCSTNCPAGYSCGCTSTDTGCACVCTPPSS